MEYWIASIIYSNLVTTDLVQIPACPSAEAKAELASDSETQPSFLRQQRLSSSNFRVVEKVLGGIGR